MKARALVMVLAIAFAFSPGAMAQEVVIGALNDMTGATSDVGKDYAIARTITNTLAFMFPSFRKKRVGSNRPGRYDGAVSGL